MTTYVTNPDGSLWTPPPCQACGKPRHGPDRCTAFVQTPEQARAADEAVRRELEQQLPGTRALVAANYERQQEALLSRWQRFRAWLLRLLTRDPYRGRPEQRRLHQLLGILP